MASVTAARAVASKARGSRRRADRSPGQPPAQGEAFDGDEKCSQQKEFQMRDSLTKATGLKLKLKLSEGTAMGLSECIDFEMNTFWSVNVVNGNFMEGLCKWDFGHGSANGDQRGELGVGPTARSAYSRPSIGQKQKFSASRTSRYCREGGSRGGLYSLLQLEAKQLAPFLQFRSGFRRGARISWPVPPPLPLSLQVTWKWQGGGR